jgi:hypothetical protein
MAKAAPLLQVFAREPVAGTVKTRLAAAIGVERATFTYRALTDVTLRHARVAHAEGIVAGVEIWCTPSPDSPWFQNCAVTGAASLHVQPEGDLDARMRAALTAGLTRADGVLLIGTDCPVLGASALAAAAAMLATHDAVLTPAEDGGFVLVGARVPLAFDDVRMSTPFAALDARAAFNRMGIRCGLLPTLWDVDEAADFDRWQRLRPGNATN